jgi:hypothetical protein
MVTKSSNCILSDGARKVLEMLVLYPHLSYGDALKLEGWMKNGKPDYYARKKGERELLENGLLVNGRNGGLEVSPQAYDIWSPDETKELLRRIATNFSRYANTSREESFKLLTEKSRLESEIKTSGEDRNWGEGIDSRLRTLEEEMTRIRDRETSTNNKTHKESKA